MMTRVCVFCGQPPKAKNKEHVLPRWLIALTGDPARKVYLGRAWTSPELTERVYRLNSFTFPACETCNTEYSELESRANSVMNSLLRLRPVAAADFDLLLDWFDKVRAGMWLSMLYLNKNYRGINPQFYIKTRIATKDRLLFIYRDLYELNGLAIIGVESPIFQVMPSCFGLIVNHLHFFNASAQDLLAERFGFPYTTNRRLGRHREGFAADVAEGTQEMTPLPVLLPIAPGGVHLYQPMIPADVRSPDKIGPWDNAYVRENCRNYSEGRGHIFIGDGASLSRFPETSSLAWVPDHSAKLAAMSNLSLMSAEWLEKLYSDMPDESDLTPEQIEFIKKSKEGILKLHQLIIDHLKNQIASATSVEHFKPE